jgi:hypothetical protein
VLPLPLLDPLELGVPPVLGAGVVVVRLLPSLPLVGAGVVVVGVVVTVGGAGAAVWVVRALLSLLLEPPQALRPRTSTSSVTVGR